MKSNIPMTEDLLVKYILGETSETEQQEVQSWINKSDTNRRHYDQFKNIWEKSKEAEAVSTVNVEKAWERFKERRAENGSGKSTTVALPQRINWMRAAAIIVLLLGAGYMVYNFGFNRDKLMAINSGASVLVDTLPDGSVVTLNKNSSLSYNGRLDGKIRSVKLQGEAFFNVAPDKEHPFVIDVNGNSVTVVGTSFNIKTSEEKTEVIVATGIVDVAKKENKVTLHPNEKATILLTKDAPIKESSTDELYNYYKTQKFVCNNTPLTRLVDVLNEAYNVQIVIENNAIAQLPFNTTFDNGSLDEALDVIQKQYPAVQISRKGNKIILQ